MIFTDAAFDKDAKIGGLGAVLGSSAGCCVAWFSIFLDKGMWEFLGVDGKETIIYELELLAACLALATWSERLRSLYLILYGNNDNVRFIPIRGTGLGTIASTIMRMHLQIQVEMNSSI